MSERSSVRLGGYALAAAGRFAVSRLEGAVDADVDVDVDVESIAGLAVGESAVVGGEDVVPMRYRKVCGIMA